MNTIRKNSQGYGYKYTDLAEIHRHMEEVGLRYYQEIETESGNDYIITHILDDADKEIRKCRGCQVVKVSGKNPAQDYGSANNCIVFIPLLRRGRGGLVEVPSGLVIPNHPALRAPLHRGE